MDYSHVVGLSFGELTVIEPLGVADKMLCRCSCGKNKTARLSHLRYGSVKSCGCLLKTVPPKVHGKHLLGGTKEYKVWNSMVQRCTIPSHHAFALYGGRGINVCDRWLGDDGFVNFLDDMGPKADGLSLDRVDNEKGYDKNNCRWTSTKTQNNNRSNNVRLTANGKTMTMAEWSAEMGFAKNTISERLKRGWSVERAINEPKRR
jgi:hypothetical protein